MRCHNNSWALPGASLNVNWLGRQPLCWLCEVWHWTLAPNSTKSVQLNNLAMKCVMLRLAKPLQLALEMIRRPSGPALPWVRHKSFPNWSAEFLGMHLAWLLLDLYLRRTDFGCSFAAHLEWPLGWHGMWGKWPVLQKSLLNGQMEKKGVLVHGKEMQRLHPVLLPPSL